MFTDIYKILKIEKSTSGFVQKALLEAKNKDKIETVLMKYKDWYSACVSVMVGCPLDCQFCATGKMGFKRNLTPEEIVSQIKIWNNLLKPKSTQVSRVVFMGMGEPFLNWESTQKATAILNKHKDFNIKQNHITISTSGIIPGIYKFTDLKSKMNLAISLHSPFQEKREIIMPKVAKTYPLTELMKAAGHYVKTIGKKVTFEYALIYKFNDNFEDVQQLRKIFGSKLFHLNLIVLNPTDAAYKSSGMGRRLAFIKALEKAKIPYTVRRSLGREIKAACGQLATQS